MNNENTRSYSYKRYDEAFQRSAVELWLQGVDVRRLDSNGRAHKTRFVPQVPKKSRLKP
jgi:hypothetical protein